jgi:hypothetical protein
MLARRLGEHGGGGLPDDGRVQRGARPIPDRPHVRLVTYEAKDPNTKYPPIEELGVVPQEVGATQPFIFSADEGLDIGRETGTAVAPDCQGESVFTGEINWVELKLGDDDHSHLIDPAEHVNILMSQQ